MRWRQATLSTRFAGRLSVGIVAALIALASGASPACAKDGPIVGEAASEREFDIPAQSLHTAILRFSDQASVQLVVDVATMGRVRTSSVKGRMTIGAALDRLLGGTGLGWEILASDTITIRRQAAPATQPAMSDAPRIFAPVHVEGRQPDPAYTGRYGSSDPTSTEGSGGFAADLASVASKRPRLLRDTPQSVSVMTSARIEQQNLTDVSDVLQQMPGVSSRTIDGISGTTFLSRGFEIHTFSFDGGGPTFYQSTLDANVRVTLETPELAEFDHIEVLRGAAGLFGGVGYPGGVINFQRKRPLDHPQLVIDLQTGSWDNHRIEADVSLPIAFDGRLRARVVAVDQSRDFFYTVTHEDRQFIYGTIEADIGPDILVRAGGSYRDIRRPGFNASGLPRYLDGGDVGWRRDACLCAPSNRYAGQQAEQFFAAEWRIGGDWRLTLNGTRRSQDTDYEAGLAYALIERGKVPDYQFFRSGFVDRNVYVTGDATLSGTIRLAGMKAALIAGVDYSENHSVTSGYTSFLGSGMLGGTISDVVDVLEAARDEKYGFTLANQKTAARQYAPYIKINLPLSEKISIDVGIRKSIYSLGLEAVKDGVSELTIRVVPDQSGVYSGPVYPSLALSYKATHRLTAHISYAKIFQPQTSFSDDGHLLPPLSGTSYESRLHWVNGAGSLNVSAAGYYEKLRNFPAYIPTRMVSPRYVAVNSARSYGMDIELVGDILPRWQIQASYNWNHNRYSRDATVGRLDTQQPAHQIKLWSNYVLGKENNRWSIGGGLRIEGRRYSSGDNCGNPDPSNVCIMENMQVYLFPIKFSQPLYAVADLRIGRQFGEFLEASLSINNVTDTHYYATVSAPVFGNYFGEPRSFVLSLKARFGNWPLSKAPAVE